MGNRSKRDFPRTATNPDEVVERLDDGFFNKLETAGGRPWTIQSREELVSVVWNYSVGALDPGTTYYRDLERKKDKVRTAAARMRDALIDLPDIECIVFAYRLGYFEPKETAEDVKRLTPHVKRLLEGLERMAASPPYGVNYDSNLDYLISAVTRIYVSVGGKPGFTKDGPLGRVLKQIWTILPETRKRPNSAEAFVRRAVDRRHLFQANLRRPMRKIR